jgi:hypothetical protein
MSGTAYEIVVHIGQLVFVWNEEPADLGIFTLLPKATLTQVNTRRHVAR